MNNGVAVCVYTDGRYDCIEKTVRSLRKHLKLPKGPHRFIIFNDSDDALYRQWLYQKYTGGPDWAEGEWAWSVISAPRRRGFAGTINNAWQLLAHTPDGYGKELPDWVWHHEDDMVLLADVEVERMQRIMNQQPGIVQMALRRQAWSDDEKEAGGVIEADPSAYIDCEQDHEHWLEHRKFFTTNPSLYRRALCGMGWPEQAQSEGIFGLTLFVRNPALCSAYWGAREDPPLVDHIGETRKGHGY